MIFGLVMLSCRIQDPPITRTDLLTSDDWFISELTATQFEDCEKDDPLYFRDDGTLILLLNSGVPCDSSGIERVPVFWKFYKENHLIWFVGGELDTLLIHELSSTVLKLENDGSSITLTH